MDADQIKKIFDGYEDEAKFELIETHISWVLIGKKRVYKIKKPVKFSFLDFSSIEKRKFFCEEEVRLNRRLSPDVYLGVVKITQASDGRIAFDGDGKVIDYAVKMKRLTQEDRMDRLLSENKVAAKEVEKIAGIIADFHSKIETITDKRYGAAGIVKSQIDDLRNHRETIEKACGLGKMVDFVLERSDSFIDKNQALFDKRQKDGCIKDCHGDLHSANIFITPEGIVVFDCIEFSKDFRYIDVASEIAFMAMDLDAFGREDLATKFVEAYIAKTQDRGLKTLLNIYKCYRANVRAKIAAIEYSQHPSDEAKARIVKYLLLAEKYAKNI
jgi:aminoglycoside phosphotransferase family enzyme